MDAAIAVLKEVAQKDRMSKGKQNERQGRGVALVVDAGSWKKDRPSKNSASREGRDGSERATVEREG